MATVYSNFYKADGTPKYAPTLPFLVGSYTAGSLSASDIITMVRVPANYEVLGGFLWGPDIDTGIEALELDIGISGDTTKFLDSGVITGDAVTNVRPWAGIWYPIDGTDLPWKPTTDTDVIITVTADAATEATALINLTLFGNYLPQSRA